MTKIRTSKEPKQLELHLHHQAALQANLPRGKSVSSLAVHDVLSPIVAAKLMVVGRGANMQDLVDVSGVVKVVAFVELMEVANAVSFQVVRVASNAKVGVISMVEFASVNMILVKRRTVVMAFAFPMVVANVVNIQIARELFDAVFNARYMKRSGEKRYCCSGLVLPVAQVS